jgi:hypothetical protein
MQRALPYGSRGFVLKQSNDRFEKWLKQFNQK